MRKKACKHEWVIYFCNKKADERGKGTILNRIEMIKPDEVPQDFGVCKKCGAVSYIRSYTNRPNRAVLAEITNA